MHGEPFICSEAKLRKLCSEYQKILRLQDWRVTVRLERISSDADGEITWDDADKIAQISILPPQYYPINAMEPQDMEVTLVHELLHCHISPLVGPGFRRETPEECVVQCIAEAVVHLKRRGDKPCSTLSAP